MDELIPLRPGDIDGDLARQLGEKEDLPGDDAFQRSLRNYKDRVRVTPPKEGFSENLWAKVAPRQESLPATLRRTVPVWIRWAAGAAATLLVAIGFWNVYNSALVVATATAAITTSTLDDGSVVTLRPHSTLRRLSADSYDLDGEAFFVVAENPRRQFRVRAGLGEIRVLGTRFNVSTWGNETVVFLERGQVVFGRLETGAVDTLAPGEELRASAMGLSVETSPSHGAGSLDWMSDALVFEDRSLSRVLAEVEHHFDITVFVPDSIKTETLSGRIFLSSADQSLRDLATVLGGHFAERRPGVFDFFSE